MQIDLEGASKEILPCREVVSQTPSQPTPQPPAGGQPPVAPPPVVQPPVVQPPVAPPGMPRTGLFQLDSIAIWLVFIVIGLALAGGYAVRCKSTVDMSDR